MSKWMEQVLEDKKEQLQELADAKKKIEENDPAEATTIAELRLYVKDLRQLVLKLIAPNN